MRPIEWIPVIGVVVSSVVVVWVVALVTKSRQRRVEAQLAMQSKLIERFGSASDLVQFLHSPAGQQFVSGVQQAPLELARQRIMSGLSRAIIMICLGAAFFFLSYRFDDGWMVPASVVLALGIGYLLATLVTHRFSKSIRDHEMAA